MKPTPGRIVFYWFNNDGTLDCRPAIITSVEDDETVNLHVFFEPEDHESVSDTETDVMWPPNFRATVLKNGAAEAPADVRSWDWPPRV